MGRQGAFGKVPRLLAGALAALAALLPGRPAHAYLYERDTPVDAEVRGFRVEDLYFTSAGKTLRLEWNYSPMGSATPTFAVERVNGMTTTSLGTTANHYLNDTTFAWATSYTYRVRVTFDESEASMSLPPPCCCADPADIFDRYYASGATWKSLTATPRKVTVDENQAVDSRLDPRFSTSTYLDFVFGSRTYRGGLWAGWANDPSRAGRSFLKWSLPSLPSGDTVWTGCVEVYATRAFADSSSTTVGLHPLTSTSWSASTLKWSTAPSVTPGGATRTASILWTEDPLEVSVSQYNGTRTDPWACWSFAGPIGEALAGTGTLAAALASTNENSGGWVYFAKKEYDTNLGACAVYAHGTGTLAVAKVTLAAGSVTGGDPVTGTVTLTGCAPSGGASVSLSATSCPGGAGSVPSSVTVPAGQRSATFTVSTNMVSCTTALLVTGTLNGEADWATLYVEP